MPSCLELVLNDMKYHYKYNDLSTIEIPIVFELHGSFNKISTQKINQCFKNLPFVKRYKVDKDRVCTIVFEGKKIDLLKIQLVIAMLRERLYNLIYNNPYKYYYNSHNIIKIDNDFYLIDVQKILNKRPRYTITTRGYKDWLLRLKNSSRYLIKKVDISDIGEYIDKLCCYWRTF